MGRLNFPATSRVYLDTVPIIYSVEKHIDYWPILQEFWTDVASNNLEIITSELTLLETLVQPVKQSDHELMATYETVLNASAITLFPITKDILRSSAEFRAKQNFKTPDAIHCATAIITNCEYFVTNDIGFNRLANIEIIVLKDIV